MFKNRFWKYFRYGQMTSFIFQTIIEFSAAIRNVYAQFLNAFVAPADLFVPTRNKSSSYYYYYYYYSNINFQKLL